eukprot:gb/GFBE01023201.1/.p1 GENE.gb/GFBE01023201.1/~~gb/GFBE01023201.1/.p1  ORF type:complete len:309 (+),score=73.47 gb/GFBE01023201.1/:1-927(+)
MAPKIESPSAYAPLVPQDGQAAIDARRHARRVRLLFAFATYIVGSWLVFYLAEGWEPLQTSVFSLSILTGIGFGHIAPATDVGKLATAFCIVTGVATYASIAGQLLDMLMHWEMDALTASFQNSEQAESLHAKREQERKTGFMVGLTNALVVYGIAVLLFMLAFGETFTGAIYNACVSVLNLDSVCTIEGVHCSPGWESSKAGEVGSMILAIVWYIVCVTTMGHFMVTFASYVGADAEPVLSRIKQMSSERFFRMDADNDGKISRSEFLRDRLIQGGVCAADQIDTILGNFDDLDKNKSGVINVEDVA